MCGHIKYCWLLFQFYLQVHVLFEVTQADGHSEMSENTMTVAVCVLNHRCREHYHIPLLVLHRENNTPDKA